MYLVTWDCEGCGHDNGFVITLIYPGEQTSLTKEQGRQVKYIAISDRWEYIIYKIGYC